MKNLIQIINEYKGIAQHNGRKSIGDPDGITHEYQEGVIEIDYCSGNPYAFIYNKKENKILFSDSGGTHRDVFDDYKGTEEGDEVGLNILDSTRQLRYTGNFYGLNKEDIKSGMSDWYDKNKDILKVLCEGRIWYLENIKWELQEYNNDWIEHNEDKIKAFPKLNKNVKAYIGFWNDIPTGKFKEYCDNIIKLFNSKHDANIVEYVALGNNGEPLFMSTKDSSPVKVEKRSSTRVKEIDAAWKYHADNTDEGRKKKREIMKGYIKSRDAHFQRDYYDKTKSKTAAEWHNNKTKRYNPHTGKMEWGEKIGDSLQMKDLKNYINEGFNSPDVFYIKHGPSVNWSMDDARPFFYNSNTDYLLVAEATGTHFQMFSDYIASDFDELKKFGVNVNDYDLDQDAREFENEIFDNIIENDEIVRGRYWVLDTSKFAEYIYDGEEDEDQVGRSSDDIHFIDEKSDLSIFIAVWTKMYETDILKMCEQIVNNIKKENSGKKITNYYFIDYNGDWENVELKSKEIHKENELTDEEKEIRLGLKAIHLASQREKRIFNAAYIKSREEHFFRDYYSKTKSKTAAEWHHTKTRRIIKDPTTGKYKAVWGEKIGDSLQMKNLKDLLFESVNKMKELVDMDELMSYKYFDVCVYDSLMKSWMSSCTEEDQSDAYTSYDEAINAANKVIDQGYYKGIQILGSNSGDTWKVLSTWGRQKFRNSRNK